MFKHTLQYQCPNLLLLLFSGSRFSNAYKWIVDNSQIRYSQQLPIDQEIQKTKTLLPVSTNPAIAQKIRKVLIKQ